MDTDTTSARPPSFTFGVALLTLGQVARDTISGWEGTLTAGYVYMNGCIRYEVAGSDKDGKPESFVFDVEQLEVAIGEGPDREFVATSELLGRRSEPTGGPRGSAPVARP